MRRRCLMCRRTFEAERADAVTCSATCRQARARYLRSLTPPLPEGPFDLVYADPGLHFMTYSPAGQGRSPSSKYDALDVAAICHLPVKAILAPHAVLALWVYNPWLFAAPKIATAWGFPEYSGLGFTWVKRTRKGKLAFRGGYTTRKGSEQCLLFKRGHGLRRVDRGIREVLVEDLDDLGDGSFEAIEAEVKDHSTKPDEVAARLERLFGDVRRIELFARRHRPGWTCWGNELSLAA